MNSRQPVIFLIGMLLCLTVAAQQNTNPSNQTQGKTQLNKVKAADPPPAAKEISERLQKLTDSVTALKARVDKLTESQATIDSVKARVDKLTESQATTDLKAKVDALSGRLWTANWVAIVLDTALGIALLVVFVILFPKLSKAATTEQLQPLQNALDNLRVGLNNPPTTVQLQQELQTLRTALDNRPTTDQLWRQLQNSLATYPTAEQLRQELQNTLTTRPTTEQLRQELQNALTTRPTTDQLRQELHNALTSH